MSTYVIGDLQGCLTPLRHLLDHLKFDPAEDRLWFAGDLVNRGPESLETLRFVRDLGDSAESVLGNHDLHLLAVMHGVRKAGERDTLKPILKAHDSDELAHWLRHRPLMLVDPATSHLLVHAGIHPHWSLELARSIAYETEKLLQSKRYDKFLQQMYGNKPRRWKRSLEGVERARFAINVFTRMRYCEADGALDFDFTGPPRSAPKKLIPWYRIPERQPVGMTVLFGHWSSHPAMAPPGIVPLDRGCLWGGSLAAYTLESATTRAVSCRSSTR